MPARAQMREFWAQNAVFRPQSEDVAYTPPSRFKYTLDGTTAESAPSRVA
jgi:hypothetical protein